MSSNQIPPPLANFSFPPRKGERLQFNYIDSFVTTWVTPEDSHDPCFLTLWYWNSSDPDGPWKRQFNQTVPLNSTKIVPLNMIGSDGEAQLNLNYKDPVSSHKKSLGAIFHVNHDPAQPRAITWNQKALSPSSSSSSSTTAATAAAQSTFKLAPSTSTVPSSGARPSVKAANTIAHPYLSGPTSTSAQHSASFSSAKTASITLGILLGVVFATISVMCCIRKRQQKRTSARTVCVASATPLPVPALTSMVRGKNAETDVPELGAQDSRWELDGGRR